MKLKDLNIDGFEQGSIGWKRARLGHITGTRVGDIMTAGRKKEDVFGSTAISTLAEIAGERQLDDDLVADDVRLDEWCNLQFAKSKAMQFGNDNEDYARNLYKLESGNEVKETGLIYANDIPWLAISPDGIIEGKRGVIEGTLEIKCPQNKNYMLYCWNITDGESLKKENAAYYWQVMAGMAVTGAKWCDFCIYSRFHKGGMKIVRIERDEEACKQIAERVALANNYINERNGQEG